MEAFRFAVEEDAIGSAPLKDVITPDDQDYIMYGKLQIEDVISQTLDTETLCNIITVAPTQKFPSSRMYINVGLYLSHTSK